MEEAGEEFRNIPSRLEIAFLPRSNGADGGRDPAVNREADGRGEQMASTMSTYIRHSILLGLLG
jgi:hypothetical protein